MSRRTIALPTLLSIVPYFHSRGPVRVADAAADLAMSESGLRAALWQLWTCGLPGYGAGDLIDLAFSSDDLDDAEQVEVTFTAGMDRPVRLSTAEAITLETALAMLLRYPEVVDPQALRDLMATLRRASGRSESTGEAPTTSTTVGAESPSEPDAATVFREAMRDGQALQFKYFSAASDRESTRVVDPARISVNDGYTYVHAVDRAAGEWRTFRTDRIRGVSQAGPRRDTGPEPDAGESGTMRTAKAVLIGSAAWFLDDFPFASAEPLEGGDIVVEISFYDDDWLERFLLGHADILTAVDDELRAGVARAARHALGDPDGSL